MTTVRNLPLISGSQNGYAQHNTALVEVAAMAFNQIKSTVSTPPVTPTTHDMHIVGASPTGAWSTFAVGSLAYYNINNVWVSYAPNNGLVLYHLTEAKLKVYSANAWVDAASSSGGSGVSSGLSTFYFNGNLGTSGYTINSSRNNNRVILDANWTGDCNILFQSVGTSFYCEIEVLNLTSSNYFVNFGGVAGTSVTVSPSQFTRDCSLIAYYDTVNSTVRVFSQERLYTEPYYTELLTNAGYDVFAYDNGFTNYIDCSGLTADADIRLDLAEIKKGFQATYKLFGIPSGRTVTVVNTAGGTVIARNNITSTTTDKVIQVSRPDTATKIFLEVY